MGVRSNEAPTTAAADPIQMKQRKFLILFVLVSFPVAGASIDDLYGPASSDYSFYGDDRPVAGPSLSGFEDDGRARADVRHGERAGRRRKNGRLWVPVPAQPLQNDGYVGNPPGGQSPYHEPGRHAGRRASLYEQFRPGMGRAWRASTGAEGPVSVPLESYDSDVREEGYRFRGDAPVNTRRGGEVSWHGGYRFRPLTEQERQRQRQGSDTTWRPSRRPGGENTSPGVPAGAPVREVYGYEPDRWFQHHYGERP
jgi:hypothetical protein